MKITLENLTDQRACSEGVVWFESTFGKEVDSGILIEKLAKEKRDDWRRWAFVNFRLSRLCESWYDNGQLEYCYNYKDGKRDGLYEGWFDNGQLLFRHNYKDWKPGGLCEGWFYNGQLAYRHNYKDGERDGLCEGWYDNGQLEYCYNYKDGVEIK